MKPEAIKGQNVTVVGGARSGLAAAKLLAQAGAKVFLTEHGASTEELEDALKKANIDYEFGGHTRRALDADFFVISPGVPSNAPLVRQAESLRKKVYSEIEAASWFCQAPIVAITGSNGKTTTTSLIGHIFRTSGRKTFVAGNIGYPLADYVLATTPDDVVVLEVSSFQLDHIDTFRPAVSVLLNITPDHLDRYDYNFANYRKSKLRIVENQQDRDVAVYNSDDTLVSDHMQWKQKKNGFQALGFSLNKELEAGAFVQDGALVLRINQHEEVLMHAEQLALRGQHNVYNSLAAAVAARVMEVRSDVIRESLASFEGVPHRLEFVREFEGVRYINDSKATNVNAVWYALESFNQPIVLIAGGRDKGNDYASLKPLIQQKGRAVIAIGESADKVKHELGLGKEKTQEVSSMESAIRAARYHARPGDVVLLSPACSSFDMFANYEDRGNTFKRLVWSLR